MTGAGGIEIIGWSFAGAGMAGAVGVGEVVPNDGPQAVTAIMIMATATRQPVMRGMVTGERRRTQLGAPTSPTLTRSTDTTPATTSAL